MLKELLYQYLILPKMTQSFKNVYDICENSTEYANYMYQLYKKNCLFYSPVTPKQLQLIKSLTHKYPANTILDYGSGMNGLRDYLNKNISHYDPINSRRIDLKTILSKHYNSIICIDSLYSRPNYKSILNKLWAKTNKLVIAQSLNLKNQDSIKLIQELNIMNKVLDIKIYDFNEDDINFQNFRLKLVNEIEMPSSIKIMVKSECEHFLASHKQNKLKRVLIEISDGDDRNDIDLNSYSVHRLEEYFQG